MRLMSDEQNITIATKTNSRYAFAKAQTVKFK